MPEMEKAVVVGIAQDQADAVLLVAAAVAEQFAARLICVWVDPEHFAAQDDQGQINYWPIDPDAVDDPESMQAARRALEQHLDSVLAPSGLDWVIRVVTGEPAMGLAAVAAEVSALMIVIGTSPRSVMRSAREFFTGSIATHLAHRQPRPVLVVPLHPMLGNGAPPWNGIE